MPAFITAWGAKIGAFILEWLFMKAFRAVTAYIEKKKREKRDQEALKKHDEVMKKPGATDAENAKSFEDTFNSD